MATLVEQWDSILGDQSEDWSQLSLEIRLTDTEQTERACVVLSPLNPWRRDDDFRIGILRFRAASSFGYGSFPGLIRTRLGELDREAVGGTLHLLAGIGALAPVGTQGPIG